MASSSSDPGRLVLNQEIAGLTPAEAANCSLTIREVTDGESQTGLNSIVCNTHM